MYEIELKLQIPKQKKISIEKAINALSPQNIALHAQYFDTKDFTLAQHFIAIRLRKEHQTWIQTLKSAGKNALERYENDLIRGESSTAPPLHLTAYHHDEFAMKALQPIINNGEFTPLIMQFETVVERTYQVIDYKDSKIEICLDIGHIGNEKNQENICEIEFELISGNASDLIELTQNWVEKYSIWLDIRSKAERGNLLARSLKVSPAKFVTYPDIALNATLAEAYPKLLLYYTQALLPHLAAIADQIAQTAHYVQAEKCLTHLIDIILEFDPESTLIQNHSMISLQKICYQIQEYLAFNTAYEALIEPLQQYQLTGLNKLLTQHKAHLSKDIITKDVTSTLLECLQLGLKNPTYFSALLSDTLWLKLLKKQQKQVKSKMVTEKEAPLSLNHLNHILKLNIYAHYLNEKPMISPKQTQITQLLFQVNLIEQSLEKIKLSKNETLLLTGWIIAQKNNLLKKHQKLLNKF